MKWVRLCREHPEVAHRYCDECRAWVFNSKGEIVRDRHEEPEERGIPPDCTKCPKMKILGKEEPTLWVRRVAQLYVTARMLGVLPGPGALMDQERMVTRAFIELAQTDYMEEQMFREMMGARVATGL